MLGEQHEKQAEAEAKWMNEEGGRGCKDKKESSARKQTDILNWELKW